MGTLIQHDTAWYLWSLSAQKQWASTTTF